MFYIVIIPPILSYFIVHYSFEFFVKILLRYLCRTCVTGVERLNAAVRFADELKLVDVQGVEPMDSVLEDRYSCSPCTKEHCIQSFTGGPVYT